MKAKRLVCALLLALLVLPMAARADMLVPGQRPPRNEASEAFVKCYADGITAWDSAYDYAFEGVEEAITWTYPGSGKMEGKINTAWFSNNAKPAEAFNPCYVDGEGRFWGYVTYAYGRRLSWICLSDPANENLPANPETVAVVEKEARAIAIRENAPTVILILAVVVITAALLYVLWRRKKSRRAA